MQDIWPAILAVVLGLLGLLAGSKGGAWLSRQKAEKRAKEEAAVVDTRLNEVSLTRIARTNEVQTAGQLAAEKEKQAHEVRLRAIEEQAEKDRSVLLADPERIPAELVDSLTRAGTKLKGGGGSSGDGGT